MPKRLFLLVAAGAALLAGASLFSSSRTAPHGQDAAHVQQRLVMPIDVATSAPDVHPMDPEAAVTSASAVPTVGYVTRHHAVELANAVLKVPAYMLKSFGTYIIISDEKVDVPNPHDLPVVGPGISGVVTLRKYLFTGRLIKGGLNASNKNPYHLELTTEPEPLKD